MNEKIRLKNGKSFESPAIFPNPQSESETSYLRKVFTRYNTDCLEGVVFNLHQWNDVTSNILEQSELSRFSSGTGSDEKDHIQIINPDVSPILGYGYEENATSLLELDIFPAGVSQLQNTLANAENQERKRKVRNEHIQPILERRETIQSVMEFQIENGADVVSSPSLPITSMQDFSTRINTIETIFEKSKAIVEGGLLSKDVDLMHTLSIDPNVLKTETEEVVKRHQKLVDVFEKYNPDIVGIQLRNLVHQNPPRVQTLLESIQKIKEETNSPIILLNTREFGLVSRTYGVDIVSTPIARSTINFGTGGNSGGRHSQGKYYYQDKLQDYDKDALREETRSQGYRFPCHCEICEEFGNIKAVDKEEWNEFRRIHYLLVKNAEIGQLRRNDKPLIEALRDKIGSSENTVLATYLL